MSIPVVQNGGSKVGSALEGLFRLWASVHMAQEMGEVLERGQVLQRPLPEEQVSYQQIPRPGSW